MSGPPPIIDIANVTKNYQGLRPLRLARLEVRAGDRLVLSGFDAASAEMFVHLVTGAAVPDEGDVRVAGHNTRDIATDTEWLHSLDRFGIVTERAVLLDGLTVAANLALPLTLAIDPMTDEMRGKVVAIASEAGLSDDRVDAAVASLTPEERMRVHLGRAIGLNPELLLLEHPTARLDAKSAEALGRTVATVTAARRLTWVALSEDAAFAHASGGVKRRLVPATGELSGGFWRTLFG